MVFTVQDKVALVTGGVSGIGLAIARNLLTLGARGVTIVDITVEIKVLQELQTEFGSSRVIFVEADVVDFDSFENAFKVTLEHFKNIDILFNNAAVANEMEYLRQIDVNVKGVVNGMILGMETYLKHYKSDQEGIIVNVSSIAGIEKSPAMAIYGATKFALTGLTVSWGDPKYYELTKVRVFCVCPGFTDTPLSRCDETKARPGTGTFFMQHITEMDLIKQSPDFVAKGTVKLLETAKNGSIWIIEEELAAYEFVLPAKNSFRPQHQNGLLLDL